MPSCYSHQCCRGRDIEVDLNVLYRVSRKRARYFESAIRLIFIRLFYFKNRRGRDEKKCSPIINSISGRECIIKITFIPRLISTRFHFNGTLIRVLERYLTSSIKKLRASG